MIRNYGLSGIVFSVDMKSRFFLFMPLYNLAALMAANNSKALAYVDEPMFI